MSMRLFVVASLLGVATAAPNKPHLVILAIDDLGWSDVGYHGSDFPTPNVDSLAASGVRLEKYYVQQVCSPTRSALMTSKYPFRTGLQHVTTLAPGSTAAIPKETPTIAEVLKAEGYATHCVGKWHLGFSGWDDTPLGRGFDSFAGYLNGAIDYYTHIFTAKTNGVSKGGLDYWRNKTVAWDQSGDYSTPFYLAEAKRAISNHDPETPMFMYYSSQLMHEPLQDPADGGAGAKACAKVCSTASPEGDYATNGRCTLCKMATNMDAEVGALVDMLRAKDMWDNTVLWFTTDNGGMTTGFRADNEEDGPWSASSNYPLRGGKATLFEGGVRGVSFVAGGGVPTASRNTATSELMMHVDVPATLAALAGATWGALGSDGVDVWSTIVSGAPSNRTEVPVNVDTCVGQMGGPPCGKDRVYNALISGAAGTQWKLIDANLYPHGCPNSTWCTGAGMYDGWWTNDPYHRVAPNVSSQGPIPADNAPGTGGVWLFDLGKDPNEKANVAAENPEVVSELRARLAALADKKNGYRDPQGNIPHPRGFPKLHNGTWAPFRRLGETLPELSAEDARGALEAWAGVYFD